MLNIGGWGAGQSPYLHLVLPPVITFDIIIHDFIIEPCEGRTCQFGGTIKFRNATDWYCQCPQTYTYGRYCNLGRFRKWIFNLLLKKMITLNLLFL